RCCREDSLTASPLYIDRGVWSVFLRWRTRLRRWPQQDQDGATISVNGIEGLRPPRRAFRMEILSKWNTSRLSGECASVRQRDQCGSCAGADQARDVVAHAREGIAAAVPGFVLVVAGDEVDADVADGELGAITSGMQHVRNSSSDLNLLRYNYTAFWPGPRLVERIEFGPSAPVWEIIICGPKADGTFWVECWTADGRVHRAMLESRA